MRDSDSDAEKLEGEQQCFSKSNKLIRKSDFKGIEVTSEEIEYRKSKGVDILQLKDADLECTYCRYNMKIGIYDGEVSVHPLLKVLFCDRCRTYYCSDDFSTDEEGDDKYCRWCGMGGKLFFCSKCIFGFCTNCIKKHFGTEAQNKIKKDDDWLCLVCFSKPLWRLRWICAVAVQTAKIVKERKNQKFNKRFKNERYKARSSSSDNERNEQEETSSRCKETSSAKNKTCIGLRQSSASKHKSGGRRSTRIEGNSTSDYNPGESSREAIAKDVESDSTDDLAVVGAKKRKNIPVLETDDDNIHDVPLSKRKKKRKKKKNFDAQLLQSEDSDDSAKTVDLFDEIRAEAVNDISKTFLAAQLTADLFTKVCEKNVSKLQRPNSITNLEELLSECARVENIVFILENNLKAISTIVASIRSNLPDALKSKIFEKIQTKDKNGVDPSSLLPGLQASEQ